MHAIPTSSLDTRRLNPAAIAAILAVVLAFRFWLAAVFPFTGDEAYFTIWGLKPDLGYYDHPPMVGWWLAVLTRLSSAEWVWRLPAILLPIAIGLGIYLAMRGISESRARWAALAYLLVPVNVWNVFVTTDTPLVLWCFLTGTCWWRARSLSPTAFAF